MSTSLSAVSLYHIITLKAEVATLKTEVFKKREEHLVSLTYPDGEMPQPNRDQAQVYYKDKIYAMGHIIVRKKASIVGDELQNVNLFRCIQNMNEDFPFNTCYTAGIAKLEEGDSIELLIPRQSAVVSLDGDSTFFGAIKLV
ncbi:Tumor necrosis factor ligand superfamily member 13B [Acipenser ruthenus]|uniref:Tumor necrosis factor ligand superfamily member 13B n=1 Tax=Acipenser ruthenus TaxID=7906 RepID=A0A444UC76_ACIRT|nr:Tumor necrosis factor ligand superfamily member 13B [Acipenser ruthenus]